MNSANRKDINHVFEIEESTVEETLRWAKEEAKLDIDYLRSAIIAGGKLCDSNYSLSTYYKENIADCCRSINEDGSSTIHHKRLPLLEIGERVNNLSGYLALFQMDAMMSLISMLEAKSDPERIMACKHAYTIIHDAKNRGLYKVISKEMKELPEEVLPKAGWKDFWKRVKEVNLNMISDKEADQVRNTIDAHKSPSFTEQIKAYQQCDFRMCLASTYAITKLAWIFQDTMAFVRQNLFSLEEQYVREVKDQLKKLEEIRVELERI